jgi:hypothetical protein
MKLSQIRRRIELCMREIIQFLFLPTIHKPLIVRTDDTFPTFSLNKKSKLFHMKSLLTGQQRILTPSRHLMLPLVFPGVLVSLIFTVDYFIYLLCALIFTADFSVYLAWLTDFDCGLFRLPNFDTLNLTTDVWNVAHGGYDRSAEDAYSSAAPEPTLAFVGGLCCPTLDFVIAFWITIAFYTLLTSLFCIRHKFSNLYCPVLGFVFPTGFMRLNIVRYLCYFILYQFYMEISISNNIITIDTSDFSECLRSNTPCGQVIFSSFSTQLYVTPYFLQQSGTINISNSQSNMLRYPQFCEYKI